MAKLPIGKEIDKPDGLGIRIFPFTGIIFHNFSYHTLSYYE
jgi:hypothetical protein